jgi:AraC-like DNA-binding protein
VETAHGIAACLSRLRTHVFRTDDLDEAVDFVTTNFGDHSRVARRRGPLGFRISFATSGRVTSGRSASSIPVTVRAATRAVAVHLPLRNGAEYRVGRRTLRSARDVAVLLCPGHDYTVEAPPGDTLALLVEPRLLEMEIDACRVKRPGSWSLQSLQLALTATDAEIIRQFVRRHGSEVTGTQLTRRADQLWAIERDMVAWLAKQVILAGGLEPLSPTSRQVVRRTDAWIREHLTHPITLGQLQVAAGVSARTLQEACLAHWGRTPLELVAARRLEAVRSMLVEGAVSTVTEAAAHSGFSHLGRFSLSYRRAYGESPSDTLARASNASASGRHESMTPRGSALR